MTGPDANAGKSSGWHIDELVTANNQSNTTMLALIEQVRNETAARDRKIELLAKGNRQTRVLTYMLGVAMAIVLILAVINAYNLAETRNINATLLNCVNSTGECGQRNAENQKRLLDEVKQYELTGFYCIRNNPADKDPRGEAFLKCMQRLYPGGPSLEGR